MIFNNHKPMKSPLIILLFCFSFINAQVSPTIKNAPLPKNVYYIQFNIESDNPNNYPASILIPDATGTSFVTYSKGLVFIDNGNTIIPYNTPTPEPWTGTKINPNNFTVNFGFNSYSYVNSVLATHEFELASTFNLHPNPIKNSQLLNISNLKNDNFDLFIYDITGKMVIKKLISNNRSLKVNISNLNQGIYLVKLVSDKKSITQKLIIAN